MPLLVVQGSEWTCIPLFTCCIALSSLWYLFHIYVCAWYISHIHSLSTSNLHNYCLYGNCSWFFTPSNALVFCLLSSYLKKNSELQTAFRIDCNAIVIPFSVRVIIFNSSFVLTVDEHWAEIFISLSLIAERSHFSVLQLTWNLVYVKNTFVSSSLSLLLQRANKKAAECLRCEVGVAGAGAAPRCAAPACARPFPHQDGVLQLREHPSGPVLVLLASLKGLPFIYSFGGGFSFSSRGLWQVPLFHSEELCILCSFTAVGSATKQCSQKVLW